MGLSVGGGRKKKLGKKSLFIDHPWEVEDHPGLDKSLVN